MTISLKSKFINVFFSQKSDEQALLAALRVAAKRVWSLVSRLQLLVDKLR